MLVLSRKFGERLVIGADIVVTVVQIEGGRVRLGIDAPPTVPISRHELLTEPVPANGNPVALPAHR